MSIFSVPIMGVIEQLDKIRKDKEELNTIINQKNLIDMYRTFYPITAEYTFFSSTQVTNTKIDHIKSDGVGESKLLSPHRNTEKQTVRNNFIKTLEKSKVTATKQMPN